VDPRGSKLSLMSLVMVMLSDEVPEVTLDLVMKARFDSLQVNSLKPKIIHMPILDQPRANC